MAVKVVFLTNGAILRRWEETFMNQIWNENNTSEGEDRELWKGRGVIVEV